MSSLTNNSFRRNLSLNKHDLKSKKTVSSSSKERVKFNSSKKVSLKNDLFKNNTEKNAKIILERDLKKEIDTIWNLNKTKENLNFEIIQGFQDKTLQLIELEFLYNLLETSKAFNDQAPSLLKDIEIKTQSISFDYSHLSKEEDELERINQNIAKVNADIIDKENRISYLRESLNCNNNQQNNIACNRAELELVIINLNESIEMIDKNLKEVDESFKENSFKFEENKEYKMNLLTRIANFKPIFKKYLILNKKNGIERNLNFSVDKYFKNFVFKGQNYLFNHIFMGDNYETSIADNKEKYKISEEISCFLSNLSRIEDSLKNQDSRRVTITYISELNSIFKSSIFVEIVNCLKHRFEEEPTLSLKYIRNNDFMDIFENKKLIRNESFHFSNFFNKEMIQKFENDEKILGFYLNFNHNKEKNKGFDLKIIFVDISSTNLLKYTLSKINEINNFSKVKTKRDKSVSKVAKREFCHLSDFYNDNCINFPTFFEFDEDNFMDNQKETVVTEILNRYFK